MENKNDFSQGNIYKYIMVFAIPLTLFLPHVANLRVKGVFLTEPISKRLEEKI